MLLTKQRILACRSKRQGWKKCYKLSPTSIPVIVPWTCVPFFNSMVTVSWLNFIKNLQRHKNKQQVFTFTTPKRVYEVKVKFLDVENVLWMLSAPIPVNSVHYNSPSCIERGLNNNSLNSHPFLTSPILLSNLWNNAEEIEEFTDSQPHLGKWTIILQYDLICNSYSRFLAYSIVCTLYTLPQHPAQL